jgi:hypothetical protein
MMNPKLAIGTITHNDKAGLDKLIQSIRSHVFMHFVVTGKFPNHPGEHDTDLDTDILLQNSIGNGYHPWVEFCPEDEYLKRQRVLELCRQFKIDALLILDSDEYVDSKRTDWNQFYNDVSEQLDNPQNVFGIIGYWGIDNEKPRLWVRPYEMTYVSGSHRIFKNIHHDNFLDTEGCMQMNPIKIKSLAFIQDSSYRTQQRKKDHDVYRDWLVKHEERIKQNILL